MQLLRPQKYYKWDMTLEFVSFVVCDKSHYQNFTPPFDIPNMAVVNVISNFESTKTGKVKSTRLGKK